MTEQRTAEWFQSRYGKFTGSQISKLMKSGRKKDQVFSDTAMTYIYDVIAEILTNGKSAEAKEFTSKATDWGNDHEDEAREVYQQFTGDIVDDVGFVQLGDHFGASPDGLVGKDGVLEIKCPFNTSNHVKHLLAETPEDLPQEYYYQMMAELLATGRKWVDFVSYDPRCDERTCLKVMRIERDEEVMEALRERIQLATELLTNIIEKWN